MTNRLAIIIVVVAILISGAGYILLRGLFSGGNPKTSSTQTPQGGTVIVPVVVTTNPSATTTASSGQSEPVIQVATVDEAYQNLFSQLQAQEVSFQAMDTPDSALSPVYKLYTADIATAKKTYPKARSFALHMASVDLNDDGAAEVLVYEDLPGFCGTAGCPLDIYQKKGNEWQQIFSHLSLRAPGLANAYTNSYRDLYLTVQVEGYLSNVARYAWNGKTFGAQTAVATWDGTQFGVPQQ